MATAQETISRAYRELNVTPLGQAPTDNQYAEGLSELNKVLRIIFGAKMGELLVDWEAPFPQRTAPLSTVSILSPANWPYPPANSRIVFGGTAAATVFFPEMPDDGARMGLIQGSLAGAGVNVTLDGNGRTINGFAQQVLITPLTPGRWIYRADLGDWRPIASVVLTDQLPFPEDMDDYFDLGLAIRLAPKNDKTISAETVAAFKSAQTIFEARYKQSEPTVYKSWEIPATDESYLSGRMW